MTKVCSSSLGIDIQKVGIVNLSIDRISKKSVVLNDVNPIFFQEIDIIKKIFLKFGDITKFSSDNSTKTITIVYDNEISVQDVLTIPEGTVESIKLRPITIESIRKHRDEKYLTDVDGFIDRAEAVLSKYYEELRKPAEKQLDDGWTVIAKKRKVKINDIVANEEAEEDFDDDDEEIDSDDC